jgi:hypothetical protein
MARSDSGGFVWGAWTSFYAALALAGFYLGENGRFEAGPTALAASFCYTWALIGGATWHDHMRRGLSWSNLAVAILGIAGVWAIAAGTTETVHVSDGLFRVLGSIVLLAAGIVLSESAGRRIAYLLVFGANIMALALAYVTADMIGRMETSRILTIPAVFIAPILQTRAGEALSVAIWGAVAAVVASIAHLYRKRPEA